MTKISLPFIQLYWSRGKQFAYYRRSGLRIRLRGEIGSIEFFTEYETARIGYEKLKREGTEAAPLSVRGSFRALWIEYKGSPEYGQLAPETRKDYARLIEPLLPKFGNLLVAQMPRQWVIARRDELRDVPSKANRLVAVIRLLVQWGMDRGYNPQGGNPALRIAKLRTGPGHRIWTESEFRTMTAPDAGSVVLPVLLARYTLQRQGDILRLTWNNYDGKTITLTQRKSKHTSRPVTLKIPVLPELKVALDAAPRGNSLTICTRPDGKPWKADHFKHEFAKTRHRLGLPDDLHFHGLRGTGATALAEQGASAHQIKSFTGHKTLSMVTKYTEQADQTRTAKSVVTKLGTKRRANKIV